MHDRETSSKRFRLLAVPLAVVMVLVGVLAALVWQRLQLPSDARVVTAPADCNLHAGPCRAILPEGGWIELDISPRPIEMLVPLDLQVRIRGLEADGARVDFAGEEMYMGHNRPELKQVEGGFAGQGILPMCVTDSMTWRTSVLVDTPEGPVAAVFRFETWRRSP